MSLPDIDIDFCERRRGEVIEYVTQKYGRANVAQIITFGTMKARAVVRDVARVMDIPYADADKVAKAVPPALDMTLAKALEESPALKDMQQKDERVRELLAVAQRLEGMTRHASVHAAGVVIAPRPLTEFVPLYKSQKDEIVTQWAMKEVERVGLLKMDFLGLSTLTLIQDCLDEIKRTEGIEVDIDAIPLDDAKTFQLFSEGCTYGVFQFESSGMRELLRKAKPERLDDLIALNALYRPGPLKSGMVDDYISRKQGKTEVKYELQAMKPILEDTYGVIAYQEQVMRIAVGAGRVHAGPVRRAAQGHGQERPQGHGEAARSLHDRRAGQGGQREEGHQDFRLDGVLRRLRLQQVALDDLRVGGVPDGVPQGELPAALHGGAAHDRSGQHRQARDVPRRVPRARRPDPAARRQSQRARIHRQSRRRPLRAVRREERRGRGRPVDPGRAQGARDASTRCSRSASTSTCAW